MYIEKFNNEDDIELITKDNKVKENIIIHKPKESYKYTYNLELENLILKEKNKQYFFLDKSTKEEVFRLSEFIMFDSNNKESKNIRVKVKEIDESNIVLEVIPSKRWMNSKVRKFPVVLDPSIESVSTDFITFTSASFQTLINEKRLGRVGIVSSTSHSLTVQVNLAGTMNELTRRGLENSNYKVLLKLPYNASNVKKGSFFSLNNGSFILTDKINDDNYLLFDITDIVRSLFLGSTRSVSFTLKYTNESNASSIVNDYIDIYVNEKNEVSKSSLILNYIMPDSPFTSIKEFNSEAGTSYLNLHDGRLSYS